MAFGFVEGVGIDLTTTAQTAIVDFTAKQTVQDVWISNRSGFTQRISLWYDYDGTLAGTPENFLTGFPIAAGSILHLTGLFCFSSGGRITAQAGIANTLTIHVSRANV